MQGHAYLAGPYKGVPLSLEITTPAIAGPFDLGDVVIRAPIYVNPETAQLTAKSDQIPTILRGIPLKIRSVAINLDRSQFGLNPTSCDAMASTASIGSSDGATATPSNRFQVGGCSNGGERKLPDLVAALDGQVDIALWGKVDSGPNHGIRNTFEVVPDAPVSRFVLEMNGGKKGLLVNSENLCSPKAQRKAIARFTGQNGKVESLHPVIKNSSKNIRGPTPRRVTMGRRSPSPMDRVRAGRACFIASPLGESRLTTGSRSRPRGCFLPRLVVSS